MSMFSHLKRDRDRGRKHVYDVLLASMYMEAMAQELVSSLGVLRSSTLSAM